MLCLSFQTADETANMARATGIAFSACDAVLIVSVFIQRAGRCDVLDPAGCCEAAETCLVRSLAGHDKGTYYIIVREDARYVYLADGRTKTAAKPKRKKRKHVQFSHKWDEALAAQFADGAAVQDEAIRYFIQKSLQGGI